MRPSVQPGAKKKREIHGSLRGYWKYPLYVVGLPEALLQRLQIQFVVVPSHVCESASCVNNAAIESTTPQGILSKNAKAPAAPVPRPPDRLQSNCIIGQFG